MNLSRVAVKQLTASDLTLFSAHYHRPGQRSKQKAINLNADVFVDEFYPGLRDRLAELHFALTIVGPQNAPPYSLSRKALRTEGAKNWRLDGELINDPLDEPHRFDELQADDLALLAFEGTEEPKSVTLVLVSRSLDAALHREVSRTIEFAERRTMKAITADQLLAICNHTQSVYEDRHPLETLFAPDTVEEAVHGSATTQERIARSSDGKGPAISSDSVRRQAATAAEVGQLGEEAFGLWLAANGHADAEVEWTSQVHARAAFDFVVHSPRWEPTPIPLFLDVKSTRGLHSCPFHMSMAEVRWAASHAQYRIARVSSLTSLSAHIRILGGVSELCKTLLESLSGILPRGVNIDSVELDPAEFTDIFSGTITRADDGANDT